MSAVKANSPLPTESGDDASGCVSLMRWRATRAARSIVIAKIPVVVLLARLDAGADYCCALRRAYSRAFGMYLGLPVSPQGCPCNRHLPAAVEPGPLLLRHSWLERFARSR